MIGASKTGESFVQKIQTTKTISEIQDLSLQFGLNEEGDVFRSIRDILQSQTADLVKEFIEKLKPIWQTDFFATHRFGMLVNLWFLYHYPDNDKILFNQLKELIQSIDKAHLLEHIFEAIIGDSGYRWCDLPFDLVNEEQSAELISIVKQQVKKVIDSTDGPTLAQDKDLKEFVSYLKDEEITSAYKAKTPRRRNRTKIE